MENYNPSHLGEIDISLLIFKILSKKVSKKTYHLLLLQFQRKRKTETQRKYEGHNFKIKKLPNLNI